MERILLLLLALTVQIESKGQTISYSSLNTPNKTTLGLDIRCISQDSTGTIWMGSDEGLYRYDGYDTDCYQDSMQSEAGVMTCSLAHGDTLFIGCENGLLKYLFSKRKFISHDTSYGDVRTIIQHKGALYIGSSLGMFKEKTLIDGVKDVYSLHSQNGLLFVGTRSAFGTYSAEKDSLSIISDNIFVVTTIINDTNNPNILYIGSAQSLYRYSLESNNIEHISAFPVVKTICNDKDGNLLIGTDNGLFIISPDGKTKRLIHDTRLATSVAGDVIWCLYRDMDDNMWIGTNNGISLALSQRTFHTHTLHHITGTGSGMQINSIIRDSENALWLGGTNGMIRIENFGHENASHRWYNMNSQQFPLFHNRIRCMYEDSKNRLWAGGSGCIMLYNRETEQFSNFHIKEDKYNWIYSIKETDEGDLFITTLHGRYIVDGEKTTNGNTLNIKEATPTPTIGKKIHSTTVNTETWKIEKDRVTITDSKGATKNLLLSERYKTLYYDSVNQQMLFGGSDKLLSMNLKTTSKQKQNKRPIITKVKINGRDEVEYEQINKGYMELEYSNNSLMVHFSDFNYDSDKIAEYTFRIKGMQTEWFSLTPNQNTLQIADIDPGVYEIFMAPIDSIANSKANGIEQSGQSILKFRITPPWYATKTAFITYTVLIALLIWGIRIHLKQRKIAKRERCRRRKIVENAKRKEKMLIDDKLSLQNQLRLQLLANKEDKNELSQDENFIVETTRIIEENISDPDLSVNNLCQMCDISTKQLYRKIKQQTGMTTVAYIRSIRLKKAANLLSNPHFTIAEVMYRVGFSNASYFTRCFQNEYGCTPTEYQEKHKVQPL